MPFTSGVFANVAGASSAAAGQIIQSAVWNNIHTDYSTAFNQLMGQLLASPSNRNIAWMNGGFEIWQRDAGSSASIAVAASTTAYTADRWYIATDANEASVVAAQTGLSDESQLCARIQRNAAQTGTNTTRFAYPLDTDEIIPCRGNIISLIFRVRAGANWSPTSGTLNILVYAGTGAVGKRSGTPYTGETSVISSSVNLTTTTALVSVTSAVVVPTTTTQMEIQFNWAPTGTAGAADYFEIDDLQLEPNLSANTWTPTNYDRIPFSQMLQGCKRHYQKSFPYAVSATYGASASSAISMVPNTFGNMFWIMCPELRTSPSVLTLSPVTATSSAWINVGVSASTTASIIAGSRGIAIYTAVSVATTGSLNLIHAVASAGI